jgi:peptidoglycan/xylan/chitin deacetylase (PgdA/CDA1 family)/glycosyltransferase involved in cell wall biosynthesis
MRLAARGHEVIVYCRKGTADDTLTEYRGMRRIVLPRLNTKITDTYSHSLLGMLHVLRLKPDAILAFNPGIATLCLIPKLFGYKVALNQDGFDWRRKKWGLVARGFLYASAWLSTRLVDQVILDAASVGEYYNQAFSCRPPALYIPNGGFAEPPEESDVPEPEANEILRQYGLEKDKYILFLSRHEPENSCDTIIKAFAGLDADQKLFFGGAPAYNSPYFQSLRQTKDPRILFPGAIYDPQHVKVLHYNCRFLVHGNLAGGTSVGLVKAMGWGTCVLTPNTADNAFVIQDPECLYESNVEHLRAKMQWLLENPDVVQAKRRRVVARVQEEFLWDGIADRYEDLLLRLAVNRKPRTSGRSTVVRDLVKQATWPAANTVSLGLHYSGLLRLGQRRERTSTTPRILVLMYHRVAEDRRRCTNLCVSPNHFRQQMAYLARGPYRVISLASLDRCLQGEGELTGTCVAVTFDDGYRDVYTNAFPIMQEFGIPATVFLAPAFLDSQQAPWWDRLALAVRNLRQRPELPAELGKIIPEDLRSPLQAAWHSPAWRLKLRIDEMISLVKALDSQQREQIVAAIEQLAATPDSEPLMMTWDMVRTMRDKGITFGAHTLTHPVLSQLDLTETRQEIADGKSRLESALGESISWFAYPHGAQDDFNQQTVAVVRECGFQLAVTTEKGCNDRQTDPLLVGRYGAPDVPAYTLATRLHSLLLGWRTDPAHSAPRPAICESFAAGTRSKAESGLTR